MFIDFYINKFCKNGFYYYILLFVGDYFENKYLWMQNDKFMYNC